MKSSNIGKRGRVLVKVLTGIGMVLISAFLLLQQPYVQTKLASRALGKLSAKFPGEITIGHMRLYPFNTLIVDDLLLRDDNPLITEKFEPQDTILYAGKVIVKFALRDFFNREKIFLSRAVVSDAVVNIVIEDKAVNIERMLPVSDSESSGPLDIHIGRASLENVRTRILFQQDLPSSPGGLDYNDMRMLVNARAHDFRIQDNKRVSGVSDRLEVIEQCGYHIYDLTGRVQTSPGVVRLENLDYRDDWSDLHIPLYAMYSESAKSYARYTDEVSMEAIVQDSDLSSKTIAVFAPALAEAGIDETVHIHEARLTGPVNNMIIPVFDFSDFSLARGASGRLSVALKDILDIQNASGTVRIDRLQVPYRGQTYTLAGRANGPLNNLAVNATLRSGGGSATVAARARNLVRQNTAIGLDGRIDTRDFDLGPIVGKDFLGACSVHSVLNATIRKGRNYVRVDTLRLDRLRLLDYDYSDINAAGTYSDDAFNGRIVCTDPNLNFIFQGLFNLSGQTDNALYKFFFNLGYADLHALGLDPRPVSKASLSMDADLLAVKGKELLGNISVQDFVLENNSGRHEVGNITIGSHANDEVNRINMKADFADATYVGSKSLTELFDAVQAVSLQRELPVLYKSQKDQKDKRGDDEDEGGSYELDIRLHDTRDLLSYFLPGMYVADSTSLRLGLDARGNLEASLSSSRIAFRDKYLRDVEAVIDNGGSSLNGRISSSEARAGGLSLKNNSLVLFSDDNHVGIGLQYNGSEDDNKGELLMMGDILRNDAGELYLDAENLTSNIYYDGNAWIIQPARFLMDAKTFQVDSLLLSNAEQSIFADGGFSFHESDTLHLEVNKFDLSMISGFTDNLLPVEGQLTGHATLYSEPDNLRKLAMQFTADSTKVSGRSLGRVVVASDWNGNDERIQFQARNDNGSTENLYLRGAYVPESNLLDARLRLNNLDISMAHPLLSGILTELGGSVNGDFHAYGPTDELSLSSENARIDNAHLRVAATGVPYWINGPFRLDDEGIHFDSIRIQDRQGGSGTLGGGIRFRGLHDFAMNSRLDITRLEVLSKDGNGALPVRGELAASGRVSITGPFNALALDVDAATAGAGNVRVTASGTGSSGASTRILTFKEEDRYVWVDPYEQMMAQLHSEEKQAGDLSVRARVSISPETEAFVDIDRGAESSVHFRGSGAVTVDIRPSRDILNLAGDYNIRSGNLRLSAMGIAQKDFTIQEGSSLKFGGDILDTDLDITALYTTKTSLAALIADTTSVATRRTVECGLRIYDKLRNPQFDFSINVPDVDPTVKSRIQSALNTEEKVQKQVVALLVTNNFLPEESSGIVNNNSVLLTNMTDILASQVNKVFQQLDIPVDLGMSYHSYDGGTNIFDVAVSTQLFNNRVVVNGNIGSRQYSRTSTQDVVGDLDIEIKLDRAGAIRMSLFSHSADEYTNFLDNLQRNGVGIAYQKEFSTFREMLRSLVPWRKDEEEEPEERTVINIEKPDGNPE